MSTVEIMKAEFLLSFIPHIETQLPYGYHNFKSSCMRGPPTPPNGKPSIQELTVDMISGYPIYSTRKEHTSMILRDTNMV